MFDRAFAREQIKMYLTADLKKLYTNREKGDHVPGYYELVMEELIQRGVDISSFEKKKEIRVETEVKKTEFLHVVDNYSRAMVQNDVKKLLNIGALTNEVLAQLYIWEMESPVFRSILSDEMSSRRMEPKEYVPEKIVGFPKLEQEPGMKDCPRRGVSVKNTDNYCFSCGILLCKFT